MKITLIVACIILFSYFPLFSYAGNQEISIGYGIGQNGVSLLSAKVSQQLYPNLWGSLRLTRHTNDGTVHVLSTELEARKKCHSVYFLAFAGLGYGVEKDPAQDIEVSTIGHWGGGIGYKNFQLRASHWSNPFENHEYGHNIISLQWGINF